MKVSPARRAALDVLNRIDTERSFSSVLLPQYETSLSPEDRGLCHQLVLGVLRRRIFLDKVIEHYAGPRKLDTAVRNSLRIGTYQLISLDRIPAYSAINESVNLVQTAKKTSAKGLVNAILRRVSEKLPTLEFTDDVERISVETSHPRWLVEKWVSEWGIANAEQTAVANNNIPRNAFRAIGENQHDLSSYERSEFVDNAFVASSIDSTLREIADRGEVYFQDEASQLVAQVAGRSAKGGRFLDVCAAPGGKTTQIAREYCGLSKSLFAAGDLHESRVRLLKTTCDRQGAGFVNVLRYDAEFALPFADESFDTVLVDAPCSGTGTIRHNPEIRYFLEPGDFAELAIKQLKILRNASNAVRTGGRLIYSTCSLEGEENEAVVAEFARNSTVFRQIRPDVASRFITAEGFVRTFPHRDGTDGFFIAQFERVG